MNLRNSIIAGIVFAIVFGALGMMSDGLWWGIINGLVAGTLFGGLVYLSFLKKPEKPKEPSSPA